MTDDDLTTAYILGVEHIRDKMHKQADEIERLRAENETLRRDVKTAVMGDSAELQDVKRENEKLREELAEYKRNGIVDVTGSMNYHSGYDDGSREERERCARICEDLRHPDGYSSENNIWIDATHDCAKAIRESGE